MNMSIKRTAVNIGILSDSFYGQLYVFLHLYV